jgi:hypothetical protein
MADLQPDRMLDDLKGIIKGSILFDDVEVLDFCGRESGLVTPSFFVSCSESPTVLLHRNSRHSTNLCRLP